MAETALRGWTHIADRAVERIARRFAQEVDGVVTRDRGPVVVSLVTQDLPTVTVESAGDRRRLALRVAIGWDRDARAVATDVQRSVRRRVRETTGSDVDRVDVTVVALVPAAEATERRRVQ